jgi:hypothetical protein
MQKGKVCLLAYDLLSGTWLDHLTSDVAHNDAPHLSHRVGCRGEFQVMSPRTCGLGGVPLKPDRLPTAPKVLRARRKRSLRVLSYDTGDLTGRSRGCVEPTHQFKVLGV